MKVAKRIALVLVGLSVWAIVLIYLALEGWWIQPVAEDGDASAFFEWASNELASKNKGASAMVPDRRRGGG